MPPQDDRPSPYRGGVSGSPPPTEASGGQTAPAPALSDIAPGFDHLYARATHVEHEGDARAILAEARRLPAGEAAMLDEALMENGGFSSKVLRALKQDAACYFKAHGFLQTVDDLARALVHEMGGDTHRFVVCEGAGWLYPGDGSPLAPRWHKRSLDTLEQELLRRFPSHPMTRKASDRREVIRRVQTLFAAEDDFFASAPPGINAKNLFLRLDQATGEVRPEPHSLDHRCRFQLDAAYDPGAEAETFAAGLIRIMGDDEEKANCFVEFLAAAIFGFMPKKDNVRSVAILIGPPRSGKSTLVRLSQGLVPAYAQASIPPGLWSDEKHRAKFRGVRLNTVTELDASTSRAIAGHHFKLIASHEPVTAREVYGQSVTFTPHALHLLACNAPPTIGDRDPSIHRRLIALRVGAAISDQELNEDFLEECWTEAPGILNYLVEAAQDVWQRGRFTLPTDNEEQVLRMQFKAQPEEILVRTAIEVAPGERVWTTDLQIALRRLAQDMGLDTNSWTSSTRMRPLSDRLQELYGAERKAANGKPFYLGIRLKRPAASGDVEEVGRGEDGSTATEVGLGDL